MKIAKILVSAEQIDERLGQLGADITRDYAGESPLLVGVLKGAFLVLADLIRHIQLPVEVDFMAVSSYGDSTKSSGVVRILKDLNSEIEGRHIILVEDIIDSGLTLDYLINNLSVRKPASIEVAALLVKEGLQHVPIEVKYQGFSIPPEFVVGYGLDHYGRLRNLPYVGVLEQHAVS